MNADPFINLIWGLALRLLYINSLPSSYYGSGHQFIITLPFFQAPPPPPPPLIHDNVVEDLYECNLKLEIGRISMRNVHPKGSTSFALKLGQKIGKSRLLRYPVGGKFRRNRSILHG